MTDKRIALAPSGSFGMFSGFDNLFDSVFNSMNSPMAGKGGVFTDNMLSMRMNLSENDNSYNVSTELAGVDKDDIDINIQDNVLTIKGEKKEEKETQDDNFHRYERSFGSFCRQIALPQDADEDSVEADFSNGVLRLTIGKKAVTTDKVKKISVK